MRGCGTRGCEQEAHWCCCLARCRVRAAAEEQGALLAHPGVDESGDERLGRVLHGGAV